MKYKIFKIPIENPDPATDAMNSFCSQHAIESIEKHFVPNGDNSFWAFCIKWVDQRTGTVNTAKHYKHSSKPKIDYQAYFDKPEDFTLFDELRKLRNDLAKEDGVPAYSIFTNAQLAEIIDQKVTSKKELKALDGIGDSKLEKYGEQVIGRNVRSAIRNNNSPDNRNNNIGVRLALAR